MGVFPGFVTDAFGLKYNSVNYGIMFIGFALAGFIGPSPQAIFIAESHRYRSGSDQ